MLGRQAQGLQGLHRILSRLECSRFIAAADDQNLAPRQTRSKAPIRPASWTARKNERCRFDCDLRVSWQISTGETKFAKASCVDLSVAGAGIECDQAIEPRSVIHLRAADFGLLGDASVRYCSRIGLKYRMGLMFSTAFRLAGAARHRCWRQSALQEISWANEQAALGFALSWPVDTDEAVASTDDDARRRFTRVEPSTRET